MATKPVAPDADQWVSGPTAATSVDESPNSTPPEQPTEKTKRLTLDIPEALHARIKSQCALRGTKMVDEIRALLEEHFL